MSVSQSLKSDIRGYIEVSNHRDTRGKVKADKPWRTDLNRVRNVKFARNLKFATSKTLVNFMKKMMFMSQNWYFSVQEALLYYTFNKSHLN